jgi:L,D-transpeptidase catalytic domain
VKKLLVPILLGFISVSFTLLPAKQSAVTGTALFVSPVNDSAAVIPDPASFLYGSMQLDCHGLSPEAFSYAWKGYQRLLRKKLIQRTDYLTICDFSQSSRRKRLYIIDVANQQLIINTYVAHGRNSGGEFATHFSNRPESLQSSLGFYITDHTYTGKHGLSLRINGVDPGYNDKAMMRTIVIHGAAYVDESRVRSGIYMGRSFGCPAVPQKESASIIHTIKNGTCLFIYHPGKNYLLGSTILNG